MNQISLYVLAHPDDEYFCSQQIQNDIAHSRRPIVLYLTDGSESLADRREAESQNALMRLGVAKEDIRFIGRAVGAQDGQLHANLQPVYDAMVSELQDIEDSIVSIRCMAWEGGHQDHDAGHVLAMCYASERLKHDVQCTQFPLYHGKGVQGPLFKVHDPLLENGAVNIVAATSPLKSIAMSRLYPSQWKTWMGLTPFFALQILRRRGFVEQTANKHRILERPHKGALLYERRFNTRYSDVMKNIEKFVEQFTEH